MCSYRVRTDGRTDGSLHLCLAFWCLAFYRGIGSLFASLSRARSWVSQCERTMSTRVCYVYAGYANELSILINPKPSSKPMCLGIVFLELRTQHFLRGRVSTYRSRHLSLCIFQACRPRPLPLSLFLPPSPGASSSSSSSHASGCASSAIYLSRLDGRRPRPPVSFL